MQVIQSFINTLTLGRARTVRNLSVVPLLRPGHGAPSYRTLDAALARRAVSITELGDGGVVAELQLINRGKRPLLLVSGEELIGAQQNRVLNVSMVAPAAMTITLPVSCVEAGRWSAVGDEFGTAGRIHYASGRARMVEDERVAGRPWPPR